MKIALLNGPNLNLLGRREPDVYGHFTLQDIEKRLEKIISRHKLDWQLVCYQSNHEGELIDFIQQTQNQKIEYVIFNPGAYTHTSIAISDAIAATGCHVIEVHISNIHKREEFRQHSYMARVALGQITGFGIHSYEMALYYIMQQDRTG